ncbi:MAG: cytochrome c maturation protein CcmE [Alphaproteobacteria bacterium]|jgi:cytochrome c-type biogenesis protein CcmE|nr:cytochrome c maturation protein CcmE [Alphaproteobacteria bacterium]
MKPRQQRALWIVLTVFLAGAGTAMTLNAFQDNMLYFHSPADIVGTELEHSTRPFRLGGLVEQGSYSATGVSHRFQVTDGAKILAVHYTGLMPALFREGQGVIAEGHMEKGVFVANKILAKHDETYMPPEVAKALKEQGHWKQNQEEYKP